MTSQARSCDAGGDVRAGCEGIIALSGRLEAWQLELCRQPELIADWIDEHGSPVNLLALDAMGRNVAELRDAAAQFGLDLGIYFARKANKALAFVDEARRLGLGIDLASECELGQVLGRGVPGRVLMMTAAIKPRSLLELCIASGTTVAVDNLDELRLLRRVARDAGERASVALRLAPALSEDRVQTRFGFTADEALAALPTESLAGDRSRMIMEGVQFHLAGYDPADRVTAISQALTLIDALRERGHTPTFIDIGGGIPVSYLDSATQWQRFWTEHHEALLGRRSPLTFDGHGLGLTAHRGQVIGRPAVYPYHQAPTRAGWLSDVLSARVSLRGGELPVAQALQRARLQLRCEPGRALLDGCGLTAARVIHRKQRRDGTWLIGLEMNRTQCRSTSDDFLVDPLLIRPASALNPDEINPPTEAIEGYLVGAYCIERELLSWRRLRFPRGVKVGDIVIFPNTAGYQMHILESSSHQAPLARNLVLAANRRPELDDIDLPSTHLPAMLSQHHTESGDPSESSWVTTREA